MKHIGKVYDTRWKVIKIIPRTSTHGKSYVLKNIYNGNEIAIEQRSLIRIDKGETSVSKVICHKITLGQLENKHKKFRLKKANDLIKGGKKDE